MIIVVKLKKMFDSKFINNTSNMCHRSDKGKYRDLGLKNDVCVLSFFYEI